MLIANCLYNAITLNSTYVKMLNANKKDLPRDTAVGIPLG